METKEQHLKYISDKSDESIRKFNFYTLGKGIFADFDEKKKEVRQDG